MHVEFMFLQEPIVYFTQLQPRFKKLRTLKNLAHLLKEEIKICVSTSLCPGETRVEWVLRFWSSSSW